MHPALHSWREEMPAVLVRGLAALCALVALSLISAWLYEAPALKVVTQPLPSPDWTDVERPNPAFALTIPEAADAPSTYAIRRHALGGRKDILTLGANDGVSPMLQIEVYRPGAEPAPFDDFAAEIATRAAPLSPGSVTVEAAPLDTKFGAVTVATFTAGKGSSRACIAFARVYQDPRMQMLGWFCQGGLEPVTRTMLACALDRFTLLAAGSEPKVTALFAQFELQRTFCGQRSPLMTPTPKHTTLWKAVEGKTTENAARATVRR